MFPLIVRLTIEPLFVVAGKVVGDGVGVGVGLEIGLPVV